MESLHQRGVRQNGIAQSAKGQPCDHGNLHRRHDLPGANPDAGEAKDAIVVYRHKSFQKPPGFHEGARPQYRRHGSLEQTVGLALGFCFLLTQPHPREFRVDI